MKKGKFEDVAKRIALHTLRRSEQMNGANLHYISVSYSIIDLIGEFSLHILYIGKAWEYDFQRSPPDKGTPELTIN